jgi:hypothetical protein
VSEGIAYCDWSHELGENGVPASSIGLMLGSDAEGKIAG